MVPRGRRRGDTGPARLTYWVFLFVALFPLTVAGEPTNVNQPSAVDEVLAAVRECMGRTPAPWPQTWQSEYVDTIRQTIHARQDDPQHAARLKILREGFGPYWRGLTKNGERSHFEVQRAQVRWYIENLMDAKLPGEEERQMLRRQYADLAEHAAKSLLAEFSFIDPNMVQKAKVDYLVDCYSSIDAPLLPIFLTPFSDAQVDQVKQRWNSLCSTRIDLWWRLGGNRTAPKESSGVAAVHTRPGYVLMQQSLGQLRPHIWSVVTSRPDYYRTAIANELDSQRRYIQSVSRSQADEARMARQIQQAEYVTFLLAALLETPACLPSGMQDGGRLKYENGVPKGGDVYGLGSVLQRK